MASGSRANRYETGDRSMLEDDGRAAASAGFIGPNREGCGEPPSQFTPGDRELLVSIIRRTLLLVLTDFAPDAASPAAPAHREE